MEYAELVVEVSKWVRHNGLHKVDPYKQYSKLMVEQARLCEWYWHPIPQKDVEEYGFDDISDIVGDYQIQLIIYCLARKFKFKPTLKKYIEKAIDASMDFDFDEEMSQYESDLDRLMALITSSAMIIKSYTENDGESMELSDVFDTMHNLYNFAKKYPTTLESSLEKAFNKIKERESE